MFKALAELAQKSTLLISIAVDGDQLRVNITPKANDASDKPTLRPLSLLATAEELDQDFGKALLAWTSPARKSLLDQVADATAQDAADADAENAPKTAGKPAKTTKVTKASAKSVTKAADPGAGQAGVSTEGSTDGLEKSDSAQTDAAGTAPADSAPGAG